MTARVPDPESVRLAIDLCEYWRLAGHDTDAVFTALRRPAPFKLETWAEAADMVAGQIDKFFDDEREDDDE